MKSVPVYIFAAAFAAAPLARAGKAHFEAIYTYTEGSPVSFLAADGIYGIGQGASSVNGNCGRVFQMLPPTGSGSRWTLKELHGFTGGTANADGCDPVGNLATGPGGSLYGLTGGGCCGAATVYQLQPPSMRGGAWNESILYRITSPVPLPFAVIVATDGDLYVGANGLGPGYGDVLQLQPPSSPGGSWTAATLYSFPGNYRRGNPSSLSLGSDGAFYGTIDFGGNKNDYGAVFKLSPPSRAVHRWTEAILYDFHGHADGAGPDSVFLGPDGLVYGTTYGTLRLDDLPGPAGATTVFSLTPPTTPGKWAKRILHSFNKDGWGGLQGITSPLILRNGKLYGATSAPELKHNGPGGMVFELTPPSTPGGAWTTTILHRFFGGQIPYGPIAIDRDGSLFGGTYLNNANPPQGTIYRIKLP